MNILGLFRDLKKRNISLWCEAGKLKAFLPKGGSLAAGEKGFIDENKPEILRILQENGIQAKEDFPGREIYRNVLAKGNWGLSYAQERLWFLEQYEGGSSAYNVPLLLDLGAGVDLPAFKQSVERVAARHEVLRTVFRKDSAGNDYQCILPGTPAIHEERLLEKDLPARLKQNINSVFDLVHEGPLKVWLLRTERTVYALINLHHLAVDGWSMGILTAELENFYQAGMENREPKLAGLDIQYKDFSLWQKDCLSGEELARNLAFWKKRLEGYEPLDFPTDFPRPSRVDYAGEYVPFELDEKLSVSLKKLAAQKGTTLYVVLLSAFYLLLHKYTAQSSLVVGTVAANRNHKQLENLIGFFVNSLVLNIQIDRESTFDRLIDQVKSLLVDGQTFQELPFEKLVELLKLEHDPSRHPIFQIMFGGMGFGENKQRLFREVPLDSHYKPAKFDLSLFIDERDSALKGTFNYRVALFKEETIRRLKDHFVNILGQIAKNSAVPIKEISFLSNREYETLIYEWNKTDAAYPQSRTIIELFEEQAKENPDQPAILCQGECLTYRELNEKTNQLAHTIRKVFHEFNGTPIAGDTLIGIYIDRSVEMALAILGILKAGAAYVPFDSADPQDRLKFKVNDCGCKMVLTTANNLEDLVFLAETDTIPFSVDGYMDEIRKAPTSNPGRVNGPENLAYIIYTSGSTGRPKGVMLEHRSVINYIENFKNATAPGKKIVDLSSSLSFDLTVTTTLVPLATGSTIAIYPGNLQDIDGYMKHLAACGVTFVKTVPSLLYLLLQREKPASLAEIFVGGEKLKRELLAHREGLTIYDEYGPTEATVGTTLANVFPLNQNGIGKPYHHYKVYILDAGLKPVPIGVKGELFIGGACLARGYFNRPELTQERFIANPFATAGEKQKGLNARIYKTGDIVRWLPDGNIEYLGRNDDQVKIRGFRIELGEIEQRLSEHPSIEHCAVVCKEVNANKYLIAYYVASRELTSDTLQDDLSRILPEHMIPSCFIALPEMPLTVNGKVNHKALPSPDFRGDANDFQPPRNDAEALLCRLWKEILGIDKVGINDDFFKLGGHSILAIKLCHRMTKELQREIPIAALFEKKTIKGISSALPLFKRLVAIKHYAETEAILSFAQERLYFIEEYERGSKAYNIPILLELDPSVDLRALRESLRSIVDRHEVLRTVFAKNEQGIVYQKVKTGPLEIAEINVAEADFPRQASERINIAFDLHLEYPIRATLLSTDRRRCLLVNIHHIAFDGWSADIFLRELNAFYRHHREGVPHGLPPLEIQYKDFALWQRDCLSGENLERELAYWKNNLQDCETLELPVDKPRPPEVDYHGDYFAFNLDEDISRQARQCAKKYGTTPYTVFLSAFYILLHKYSGQSDIVVGAPTANRHYAQLENLIGFFVNSTPMRFRLAQTPDIKSLMENTAASLADMQSHQDLPFEKLVDLLGVPKDPSRHPLIQVMFSVQSFGSLDQKNGPGLFKNIDTTESYKIAKYDLSLFIDDSQERFSCGFNYATSLFTRAAIERMASHYNAVLRAFLSGENRRIKDINLLTGDEFETIIRNWNKTALDYGRDQTIAEAFEAQAMKTPGQTALVFGGEKLTYRQLNQQANQIAAALKKDYLQNFGEAIKPGALVGLYLDRSVQMIAAILGILKAGAAYVPFDRADPAGRLQYKIEDCACKMMLTSSACAADLAFLPPGRPARWEIDRHTTEIAAQPDSNPNRINRATDLAYVIYTSGSTGQPKGVMLEHYGVINLAASHRQSFNIGEQSTILQFAPVSFDASVSTLFTTLLNGGTLCLCPEETRKDTQKLGELIVQNRVTLIDIPARLLEVFPRDLDLSHLRCIITAGEVCDQKTMDYWSGKVRLINAYGPTEGAVCATFSIHAKGKSNKNIGKPIGNKKVYVLNSDLTPLPVGAPGELYLGGDGLARGYLNRPEITRERFMANPFLKEGGPTPREARIYKTGDLVRWLDNGELEFLGRNDDQVKIHGYRIELGEIEQRLSAIEGISLCAVKVFERENSKCLCAYYSRISKISENQIRNQLAAVLPDYMTPAYYVELESFPLNTSGKIDRKALPSPDLSLERAAYTAPGAPLEKTLCETFQKLLHVDKIGVNDDFFKNGGDSILSIQLCSALKKAGISCAVKDLFKNPTVKKLANHLSSPQGPAIPIIRETGVLEGEFELLPIQKWFFDKVESGSFGRPNHWNQSFMLKVPPLDPEAIKRAISALTGHHDMLRATFKGRTQKYNPAIAVPKLKLLDRSGLADEKLFAILTEWQSGFDIENGPLWQIGYITGYPDGGARLFFAFHHLIIDAVSWRIISDDFRRVYDGEPLNEKGSSYRQWVHEMGHYRQTHREEAAYWENVLGSLPAHPIANDQHKSIQRTPSFREVRFEKEFTAQLLKEAHAAYATSINDLLLTAAAYMLKDWLGGGLQGITLEGHGRENINPAIDHSHTVGWFTNTYPVKLEVGRDMSATIMGIKENLTRIPNKGIGFGACLSGNKKQRLPPITFNYLGQLDGADDVNTWPFAAEPAGQSTAAENSDTSLIAMNGFVAEGELRFQFMTNLGEQATAQCAQNFERTLKTVVEHCLAARRTGAPAVQQTAEFEYVPCLLLNQEARSNKLMIMVHPDSGYEAYMASLYPALSSDIKVILIDNYYKKVYLQNGVTLAKSDLNGFKDLADYYIKLLFAKERELLEQSACSLLGYSFGCPIAWEMHRILKGHAIAVNDLYMVDPLLPSLLKTKRRLNCFSWYEEYLPAPTETPVIHFHCTVPDPSIPGYAEHFTDKENYSLRSIAQNLREYEIKCHHTGILNNPDFIKTFQTTANSGWVIKDESARQTTGRGGDIQRIELAVREILSKIMRPEKELAGAENLFHQGCASIQTLSILAMVNDRFRLSMSLPDIIRNFTIDGLAALIAKNEVVRKSDPVWEPVVFKSRNPDAANLYFLPGFIGSVGSYSRICSGLSRLFNVIFMEPKGMYGDMTPFASPAEALAVYASEITQRNKIDSPVFLAGHSVGSVHSLDLAIKLEEMGYRKVGLINIDGYLHKMESLMQSFRTLNLDAALVAAIKRFFKENPAKESALAPQDPVREIASILFPSPEVSRDYALRVALGYRNIWHQQIDDIIKYNEPSRKFAGKPLAFITLDSDKKIQEMILRSCHERYAGKFQLHYIEGDHLSCIIKQELIEKVVNLVSQWKESSSVF
ncbi:MAG: amino acid adenylation domain-containing protein [Verrucomicrobiae bacterium]|nr:amino acid adenylation domain-containing protein [Verrucomicrobiae bacterium]